MSFDILSQKNWRAELLVPTGPTAADVSYGYWNRGELTFGADNQTVTDPETGSEPVGGTQTAETVPLTRPFKASRDTSVYQTLKPLRGRIPAKLMIWVLDDFGSPVSSTPIDTLTGTLGEIKLPEGTAGGSDPSQISVSFEPKP